MDNINCLIFCISLKPSHMMECTCKGDAVEEKGMCALVSSAVVCVHWYVVPWNVCTGI